MKKYFFLFLLIPFLICAENLIKTENQSQKTLCIQTLNTYGVFYSNNLEDRHQQTLFFLKEQPCDIILFQEIWQENHYENFRSLSRELNMESIYFGAFGDQRKSGLVGLFKGKIYYSNMCYFPNPYNGMVDFIYDSFKFIDKGFGFVQMNNSKFQNYPFWIFNLHLDHASQTDRISQILFYLKWMLNQSLQDTPMIMAGDFNFGPNSLEFDMIKYMLRFKDPYEQINKEHLCTHLCEDSDYGLFNFLFGEGVRDYIFFRSSSEITLTTQDIVVFPKNYNGISLSDHYGLRAFFKIKENVDRKNNHFTSRENLKKKIGHFKRVLNAVESILEDHMDSTEEQFIRSLREDIDQLRGDIIDYLQFN